MMRAFYKIGCIKIVRQAEKIMGLNLSVRWNDSISVYIFND